jgi:hypothetical protein
MGRLMRFGWEYDDSHAIHELPAVVSCSRKFSIPALHSNIVSWSILMLYLTPASLPQPSRRHIYQLRKQMIRWDQFVPVG